MLQVASILQDIMLFSQKPQSSEMHLRFDGIMKRTIFQDWQRLQTHKKSVCIKLNRNGKKSQMASFKNIILITI